MEAKEYTTEERQQWIDYLTSEGDEPPSINDEDFWALLPTILSDENRMPPATSQQKV